MPKKSQWSIRHLLLWVFVLALVASHVANFYHRRIEEMADFSFSVRDIEQWLRELDPSVKSHEGAQVSPPHAADAAATYSYFVFTAKNATSKQLLDHLENAFRNELGNQNWTIERELGFRDDSFVFHASSHGTQYKIIGGLAPNSALSQAARQSQELGETVTTIKIIQIGHLGR